MFKLPDGIPTLRASSQEWADYAEYKALKKGSISLLGLIKMPLMVSDELTINGTEDDTDKFINKIDEIATEIKNRILHTRNQYPFELLNQDYTLSFIKNDSLFCWIYIFLLLSTRINMASNKIQNGLDGTQLFESLSAEIVLSFLGKNSNVDILGTSKVDGGGFREKLSHISKRMGEGGQIHKNEGFQPQDDNVDVIAWKGFSDKKASQIVAFGQCKTGTSWQNTLSELNVDAFCRTWFSQQPVLTPTRMFFCAQYFPKEIWRQRANEAGLVFDRCRIIDYLPKKIDKRLLDNIKSWSSSAGNLFP